MKAFRNIRLNGVYRPIWVAYSLFIMYLAFIPLLHGHPAGNLVSFKGKIFWSYIYPLDDPAHQACIMTWDGTLASTPYLISDYTPSDYFLYADHDWLFIIERRYDGDYDEYHFRVLKTDLENPPQEIWAWQKDDWRVGEAGFVMYEDDRIVFNRFPDVYEWNKSKEPQLLFQMQDSIHRIRGVGDKLLLITSSDIKITDRQGHLIKSWDNLYRPVNDPPLGRNMIFDADYQHGELLIAYWGSRTFDRVDDSGCQEVMHSLPDPFVPHWVLFYGDELYLFSSGLSFNGSLPVPHFIRFDGQMRMIWGD